MQIPAAWKPGATREEIGAFNKEMYARGIMAPDWDEFYRTHDPDGYPKEQTIADDLVRTQVLNGLWAGNQGTISDLKGPSFSDHIEYTNRLVLFLIGSILIVAIMSFILFKK